MASTNFGSTASTIHHWCGILDGRYNDVAITYKIKEEDSYQDTRLRIMNTDVLVIDEIGKCLCPYNS